MTSKYEEIVKLIDEVDTSNMYWKIILREKIREILTHDI